MKLNGKIVLVTGGSRGLGRAIANACAEEGADLVITGRDKTALDATADRIRSLGRLCMAVELEVTDSAAVENAADKVWSEIGPVDVAFNNAGTNFFSPTLDTSDDDWHRVIEVNLSGVFYCCRSFGKRMLEQGRGKIINTSTDLGIRGFANAAAYAASKGGLIALSKSLAWEWAPTVTVNVIAPGPFYTDLTKPAFDQPEMAAGLKAASPLGRWAQPNELGPLAVLMAGEGSDFMTGTVIGIDGGIMRA